MYYINPRFQYISVVGNDPEILQVVYEVFVKLHPTIKGIGNFGNEANCDILEVANEELQFIVLIIHLGVLKNFNSYNLYRFKM